MEVEIIDLEFQGFPEVIAAYLVSGPDGKILIETGPESTRPVLVEKLKALGISPGDIAALFVTHIHLDHAGAVGFWTGEGVPVYVHPKGAKHLIDPEALVSSARAVYGEVFDYLWGQMIPSPENLVRTIEDGETVTVAGLEIRAIDSPGHAFHHHCYQINDALFTGDAVGARISPEGFLSVTSAPTQFHLEYTLETLEKIRNLTPVVLYPTHYGPIVEVDEHLDSYRDAVELNVQFIHDRMEEGMDAETMQVAYKAFTMEQSFRAGFPAGRWDALEAINGTAMCADGIRMYWEKKKDAEA